MSDITDLEFRDLEKQDVREYWEHEAHEFTPWLANQIQSDKNGDVVDFTSTDTESEMR